MPDPLHLPAGCKFCDRCKYRMDICEKEEPPVYTNGTHSIQCFKYKDGWED